MGFPQTPHPASGESSPEPPEYQRRLVGGVEGGGFGFRVMSKFVGLRMGPLVFSGDFWLGDMDRNEKRIYVLNYTMHGVVCKEM